MKNTAQPQRKKRSYRAVALAHDVIDKVRKGEDINLTKLQIKHGYSATSANSMKGVQTQVFKDTVEPVLEDMRLIHKNALRNLKGRDLTKERMDSVVNLAKQMVHDTQLLSGKATDNTAIQVVVYGSNDFLSQQLENKKEEL